MADKPKDNPDWWSRILDARKSTPSANPLEAILPRREPRPASAGAVIITNVRGTSNATCSCVSWLAHWEKMSGQTTKFCQVVNCHNTDVCGAHVRKAGDSTIYIYPLCAKHNQSAEPLEVSPTYKLVPATEAVCLVRRPKGPSLP